MATNSGAPAPGSDAAFAREHQNDARLSAEAHRSTEASLNQVKAMQGDFTKIKQMAADGGFAVDPDSGQTIIKAIDDYRHAWEKSSKDIYTISQSGLPLGQVGGHYDHYASHVSGYHQYKASDGYAKFDAFYNSLGTFKDAINQAIKNFAKMDDDQVQTFKSEDYQ